MTTIKIKFDKGSTLEANIEMTNIEKEHIDSAIAMLNYYTDNKNEIFNASKPKKKKVKKSKKD